MEITIISDFICPYCYIAHRHIDLVLDSLDYRDEINISHRSFQLYPDLDEDNPIGLFDAMKSIKNLSYEHVELLLSQIDEVADQIGLEFNFNTMKYTNTFKAHRLFQFAEENGRGNEFYLHMYKGFFTDGQVISDNDFLVQIAGDIGLDKMEAYKICLEEDVYKDHVLDDIAKNVSLGVMSVPFIVFEEEYGIYGGRSMDLLKETMDKVRDGSIAYEDFGYKNPIRKVKKLRKKDDL